jgi:hypothetical protein
MELSHLRLQVETLLAKAEKDDCLILNREELSALAALARVFALPWPGSGFQSARKMLTFLRVARQAMSG